MSWGETLREFAFLLVAVLVLLSVGGCGAEPEAQPVAVHEVCAVTLHDDGSVTCTCEEKKP